MKAIIVANEEQQKEIVLKNTAPNAELIFVSNFSQLVLHDEYDAIFYLFDNFNNIDWKEFGTKPVFINSVIETLQENKMPLNFSRINGWPGFLQRQTWEAASNDKVNAAKVFETLDWKIIFVKDEPGMVAARVISMIINEAFFAIEEGVSSIDEIDLAMKLGTNYPYGPFEWQKFIGLENIYLLLKKLSVTDKRYSISPLLEKNYFNLTAF